MPFETGFVPSDGYRHYYHGYCEKMEFEPCGHVLDDYYNADFKTHSDDWAYEQMKKIRERQKKTFEHSQKCRTFPHERNLMNGVQCPYCDVKSTGIQTWINNNVDEVPERQFKAFRIMGWV